MLRNVGTVDRLLRVLLGALLLVLGWTGTVSGGLGTLCRWVGFVPLLTGLLGWCPLYSMLHCQTTPGRV